MALEAEPQGYRHILNTIVYWPITLGTTLLQSRTLILKLFKAICFSVWENNFVVTVCVWNYGWCAFFKYWFSYSTLHSYSFGCRFSGQRKCKLHDNHCKSMKAESRQIPQKLATRLKFLLLLIWPHRLCEDLLLKCLYVGQNCQKVMKAKHSMQIPQKLTANLEPSRLSPL